VSGRIFVTRRIPDAGLNALRDAGVAVDVGQSDDEAALAPAALAAGVASADVVLSLLTERIDRTLLETAPRLRGIANYAVGFDNIDVAAATALGIPVSNTPGVLTEATADFTWALLLAVARRIPEAHRYTVDGRYRIWGPNLLLGSDVGPGPDGQPKTLGIVGYGRIGQAVARRAHGFGMRVIAHDPHNREEIEAQPAVDWAGLSDLLARSDFVSLHAALTPATRHLIGDAQLRAMKRTAYLINAARGPLVDEAALVRALREGRIAGAALDVYEHEPALAPGLTALPNVVLAPHIASATVETRARMATIAASNALAHHAGRRAPHCVNPDVYASDAYQERLARTRSPGAP
jgi:glyoxylate reductase